MADQRFVYARAALTACVAGAAVAAWLAPRVGTGLLRPTDFERELRQADAAIDAVEPVASGGAIDAMTATMLAGRLYQRASLAGRDADFTAAQDVIARVLTLDDPPADLPLLEATLDFRGHRFAAARTALARVPSVAASHPAQAMLADLDAQNGSFDVARARYEALIRDGGGWDIQVRLASLTGRQGDIEAADRIYVEAEEELTAKQMRAFAWIEVQRGYLQFTRGRYDAALARYQQAARAYSGYWLVDEYTAELLGAQRKFDQAIASYEHAIARAPRPDLLQQLGDLYLAAGRPREATAWHDQALDGYRRSVHRGEVQFFHHLATFYADIRPDAGEAVTWARRDFELRPNAATEGMLAWALYRHGQLDEALGAINHAVTGLADAHLYYYAAMIHRAAGRSSDAQRFVTRLAEINPRYNDFHVHR